MPEEQQYHTPGPWHVMPPQPGMMLEIIDDAMTARIGYAGTKGQPNEANARLMAAAPELLASCRAMATALGALGMGGECDQGVWDADKLIESAIAKATGKPA